MAPDPTVDAVVTSDTKEAIVLGDEADQGSMLQCVERGAWGVRRGGRRIATYGIIFTHENMRLLMA